MINKGRFIEGSIPWNKGTKGVMGAWNKGKKMPDAYLNLGKLSVKGAVPWNKGKKLTPEHVEKLRISHLGQKAWNKGIEWGEMKGNTNGFKKGMETWNRGMEGFLSGDKHYNWKGGITPDNQRERASGKYIQWRTSVFKRDNYTCQICGKRGEELNADHIKPWALFKDLRFELSNGRTLCETCHKDTPNYGNKKQTAL